MKCTFPSTIRRISISQQRLYRTIYYSSKNDGVWLHQLRQPPISESLVFEAAMNQSLPGSLVGHVLAIPRGDRWRIYHRLQELLIPCWCSVDGYIWVEINDPVVAAQVRSVVQQFFAPRRELLDWLEQCWQLKPEEYQSN